MTKVAIVKSKGDGGYQEPNSGVYISSQRDTIVPFSDWVENLVNHDKVAVIDGPFEGSDYGEYVNHVAQADGDQEKALAEYKKLLPVGNPKAEKVRVVESPADLEAQVADEKATTKPAAPAPTEKK